jgi:hypothetical protein
MKHCKAIADHTETSSVSQFAIDATAEHVKLPAALALPSTRHLQGRRHCVLPDARVYVKHRTDYHHPPDTAGNSGHLATGSVVVVHAALFGRISPCRERVAGRRPRPSRCCRRKCGGRSLHAQTSVSVGGHTIIMGGRSRPGHQYVSALTHRRPRMQIGGPLDADKAMERVKRCRGEQNPPISSHSAFHSIPQRDNVEQTKVQRWPEEARES